MKDGKIRVYVGGSRNFGEKPSDIMLLHRHLNALHSPGDKIGEIVQGGQGKYNPDLRKWLGADYWAMRWASERGVVYITLKPQWTLLGRGAGMIRNVRLLDEYPPDICVFTRGGPGTKGAMEHAEKRGYVIEEVDTA